MQFTGDLAQFQQAASRTEDYAARRAATLRALEPRGGETILEVGCGGGLLLRQIAEAVGPIGKGCGIDVSEEQLQAARGNCADLANAELQAGSALSLAYAAGSFDAVASIQVLEYIDDVQQALEGMHRVLKPGGRLVNFATNWGALFWNSRDPARMKKMLGAWDLHAPHANLPAHLRALLTEAGFSAVSQSPVAMLNCHYDDRAYSYWLARIMAAFATGRGLVGKEEAQEWLKDLAAADARNEYLFCSIAIVTRAAR